MPSEVVVIALALIRLGGVNQSRGTCKWSVIVRFGWLEKGLLDVGITADQVLAGRIERGLGWRTRLNGAGSDGGVVSTPDATRLLDGGSSVDP